MGTPYPTEQEHAAIKRSAKSGDKSASQYLELIDTCTRVLESTNGISLARGMVGEHNDVYSHAIDDALGELMPVIFQCAAGGWEGLKWYVPDEKGPDERQQVREDGQAAIDWQKLYGWAKAQPAGAILGQSCTNSDDPLCMYLAEVTMTRLDTWSIGPSIKTGYGDKLEKPEWIKALIEETDKATGGQSGPVSRELYLSVLERVKPEDEV